MPRETLAGRRQRTVEIIERLKVAYPGSECSLVHGSAWRLLVATILSAQCTDERVNEVTPELFARFPSPQALAAAPRAAVEETIRSTGFFRNKAKSIQGASERIVEAYGGKVPDTMEELLTLPGVARKTANVVLHVWYGAPTGSGAGVVVDTHVTRVAGRLRLTRSDDPKRIEKDLERLIPAEDKGLFTHLIIDHGRAVCTGRTKPRCEHCVVNTLCPSAFLF